MIGVPFLGLLTAIFETAFIYMQSVQLQNATEHAAYMLLTNGVSSGLTANQFATNYICPQLTSMFNCSLLQVTVSTPSSWSAANTQAASNVYAPSGYNGGQTLSIPQPGNIAVVQVAYPMNQIVAIMAGGVVMNQTVTQVHAGQIAQGGTWANILLATAVFQVEP